MSFSGERPPCGHRPLRVGLFLKVQTSQRVILLRLCPMASRRTRLRAAASQHSTVTSCTQTLLRSSREKTGQKKKKKTSSEIRTIPHVSVWFKNPSRCFPILGTPWILGSGLDSCRSPHCPLTNRKIAPPSGRNVTLHTPQQTHTHTRAQVVLLLRGLKLHPVFKLRSQWDF